MCSILTPTCSSHKVPVQLIPRDPVTHNKRNNNRGGHNRPNPENQDAGNIGAPPHLPEIGCPLGVQVVLQHHVCHHECCDEIT